MNKQIDTIGFWIHLTDNCNLTCDYCYISTLKEKMIMSSNVIEQLIYKLNEVIRIHPNIKNISLKLAGGEPLTKFHNWKNEIEKLIYIFKSQKINLNIRILTNLTILDDEIIKYCIKNEIYFSVSLDGLDYYHNKYRKFKNGKGSFNIVKNNLFKLDQNKIKYSILVTISNYNLDGIVDLIKFLIRNKISFRLADEKGSNVDRNKIIKVLNECYLLIKSDKNFDIKNKHVLCDLNIINESKYPCSMGISSGAIYTNGDIFFCHSQFGSKKILGNLNDSEDLLEIIHKGLKFHSLSVECSNCNFKTICAGGCPLYRNNENKTPMCNVFKQVIPKIQDIIKFNIAKG